MSDAMAPGEPLNPEALLQQWLDARLDAPAAQWLQGAVASVAQATTDRELFRSISLVSRKLGKAPLALDAAALATAEKARPGWNPSTWTLDQAGRVRLLLATVGDSDSFVRRLDQLCATADVDELVAFYRGLPLYPDAPQHRLRAAEGLRSNMKVVFEAVAHANPYPAEQLAQDAWNQMVLKAIFVGSALAPIIGLDQRANATLARMLGDYAHERWAASRPVNPELWRCVGPFVSGPASGPASGPLLADLARVLASGTPPERAAAMLALRGTTDLQARKLQENHAGLRDAVAAAGTDWGSVLEFK